MRTHLLYVLVGLFFICTNHQMIAQSAKKPTERGYVQPQTTTQQKSTPNQNAVNYATKAEKYAADGLTAPTASKKSADASGSSDGSIFIDSNSSNISAGERCLTDQSLQRRLLDPNYREYRENIAETISSERLESIPCDAANSVVIPVAVHFDAAYTCANTQCLIDATTAQIQSLNDDFAALNADLQLYNDIIANCGGTNVASDGVCLTFCLATQNHPAASGIPDGSPAITIGEYTGGFGAGGGGAPDWAGYLNMFVIDGLGFGVADGIPGNLSGDGVSQDGSFFGGPGFAPCSSGGLLNDDAAWNLGRTMTHEVGHYLGLYHTFQGGCGDEPNTPFDVNDTPAQANSSAGVVASTNCAALATGCVAGEFVQKNYMDYFDDLSLVMFSNEQAIAMNTFSNSVTWAAATTACSSGTETSLAACSLTALFDPPNGSEIVICTDDGTTIQFADLSTNGPISWNWTFTVTGGDITLSSGTSTMQNPAPMVTGGTSGTIDVTLSVSNADGTVEAVTQSYTVTVVSGDACPNECDYTLNLTDDFGDGWNGATVEIFENGVSVGVFGGAFTTGTADGPYTVTLTDGATIDVVQTNGGFAGEEGFTLVDAFGFTVAQLVDGAPLTQSFTVSCSAPTCDDTVQNGNEGGIDCGGTSPCPDCCGNGVQDDAEGGVDCGGGSPCGDCCGNGIQDDDETGVDCGGANCAPCPSCPDGFEEIVNETFDGCAQPADWTITTTGTATVGNGVFFNAGPLDVPGGGVGPSPDFAGCILLIDDDFADNVGLTCVLSPVIDLTAYVNTSLVFDWQHEAVAGGGEFIVQVFDGTSFVTVFSADDDSNGTNETISLDVYANPNFQVQFCYDDEGGFQWGAGIDNVSVCGEFNDECPTSITPNDISGDYCDGADATVTVNFNPNATYAWSSDNPNVTIVDAAAGSSAVTLAAPTACTIETANISLVVVCDLDGVELFNGVVSTVNVYPAAPATPADLEALLVIGDPSCDEPVTVVAGCESFVVLTPDAGNPAFPVNVGDAGTATYTATYTTTPDCCPDVSGATTDLVVDGSFEAGPGGGAWTEASTNFGTPICDLAGCGTGTGTGPSDGNFWAWFGGIGASEIGSVCQSITVPAGVASLTLSFDLETIVCDSPADFMEVTIDGTQVYFIDGSSPTCGVLGYVTQTIDLLAAGIADGATYTLCFESEIFGTNGTGTNFFVDNVQVIAEQPPMEDPCMVTVAGDYDCAGCAVTPPTISTTSNTDICTGDGAPDMIDVTVDDPGIGNPAWVITDANGIVLALPSAPPFDLEGAGAGTCLIWLANIDDPNFAIAPGDDAASVIAAFCAELSNPITVTRAADCAPMIGITDPCNCDTGLDLDGDGSNDIVVETITIMPGTAPYTITAYSGGLVDMAGGALDQAALQALLDAAVPDADGNVSIAVYIPADGATVFSVTIADNNGATADFTKVEPCTSCETFSDIPTVGEWGLIILGLMMMIVAIVGIRERRKVYA